MKQENENKDKIVMITDSGESVDFYVLEETRIDHFIPVRPVKSFIRFHMIVAPFLTGCL